MEEEPLSASKKRPRDDEGDEDKPTATFATNKAAVQEDAALDPTVTNAVQAAREAASKFYRDGLPFPKECMKDSLTCKRTKGTRLLKLKIPLKNLVKILKREETFRLSPQLQALYDEFKQPPPCVEATLQTRALEEHGFCCCYLNRYWQTSQRVDKSKHPEIWNSVVYLRYFDRYLDEWQVPCKNRNQDIPHIPLVPTEDKKKNARVDMLTKYHTMGRPLVVVSGSQS
tara:strand:+ start:97 stop:780 length:684 start_codon:yes stop_codon:yes gene_type:complete